MIASLPHFYLADPKLVENIESGINPVKDKHEISMLFEIVSIETLKLIDYLIKICNIEFNAFYSIR